MARTAVVLAVTVLGLGVVGGVAGASAGGDWLGVDEMPEQKTTYSTCQTLVRQGSAGYAMQNRDDVSRVYEFAGYNSDPQGYIDMRVNVYVDDGNWLVAGGWGKGDYLGVTFIGCS